MKSRSTVDRKQHRTNAPTKHMRGEQVFQIIAESYTLSQSNRIKSQNIIK